ncbi:MAG: DUF2975 domain-containing protein [Bacteroidota bacterium]|nr:DUF2975 domain-containing protein [Bacteroidota bacterium]
MKTKTEIILVVLKVLALIAAIGFSIECGAELLTFVSGFINPGWAKNVLGASKKWFQILDYNTLYFAFGMSLIILASALKAAVWYIMFDLLQKLQLKSPFSMTVTKKLEKLAYLLLGVWILIAFIGKTYLHYVIVSTGINLTDFNNGDEYLFIAGMVYIISQIFRRGIELQNENDLTV